MRMCLIFGSVPFFVLQTIFPYVRPVIWPDSLLKQNVSNHLNHMKVNYDNRYIKIDRTTDRQTYLVLCNVWILIGRFFRYLESFPVHRDVIDHVNYIPYL